MAQYSPIMINYNPQLTYPGTQQDSFVGAQTTAGQREILPAFSDSNAFFVGGSGASDSNTGTSASPFKTIHHAFDTTPYLNLDVSGSASNLTQTGTVPALTYPVFPAPAQGNTAAGPFSATQHFSVPVGASSLSSKISSAGQFTFECYLYVTSLAAANIIFLYVEGLFSTGLYVNTNGDLQFTVSGNSMTTPAATIAVGQWYHVACVYSGTTQTVYVNGASVGTPVSFTHTIGTITSHSLGSSPAGGDPLSGYLDRVVYSNAVRTSFPTARGTANIVGFYNFETDPLIQSSAFQYVVIQDSGQYNERPYINFPDDLAGIGLYAADGQAPTIQVLRGAVPDTYGAGNPARSSFSNAPASDTLYVTAGAAIGTGIRGDSAAPFKSVSEALAYNGSRGGGAAQNGDTVQIQDSALYKEDINYAALTAITVQAASGQSPILKNVNMASSAYHLQAAASSVQFFSGLTFQDSGNGSIVGPGAGYNFSDCTFCSASGSLMNLIQSSNTASVLPGAFSLINCYLFKISLTEPASSTTVILIQNFKNTYFKSSNLGQLTSATASGIIFPYTVSCTFDACGDVQGLYFDPGSSSLPMSFFQCLFLNSSLQIMALPAAVIGQNAIVSCDFVNGNCGTKSITGITGGGILKTFVENCMVQNGSFLAWTTLSGTNDVTFRNCTVLFAPGGTGGAGYYISQATGVVNANIGNCCSIASASYGIDQASGTAAVSAFLEQGSATAPWTGLSAGNPTFSESGAEIINSSSGFINTALTPGDGANFGGSGIGLTNIGPDAACVQINVPTFVVNGVVIAGEINAEGGINSPGSAFYPLGTPFNVAYCTFNGLGNYGIKSAQFGQTYSDCLFVTNGYGVQLAGQDNTVSYNIFSQCGSAGLANYGQNNAASNNSAYGCLYGQFDQFGSYSSGNQNNIYISSGAYDYSGDNLQSYCCIGTLDPERNGALDGNSTNMDPLFNNIAAGDYRLQTVENGYYFNSPAKLAGSDGYDMGCFQYVYGALVPVWEDLTLTNNPDQVQRTQSVIKLAEGDTEGGNLYSRGQAFQVLYQFIWNSNNPMPATDLAGLTAIYTSLTGQCQLSFDSGKTWIPVRVVKSQGYQWTDLDTMFNDNQKPTPLQEIDFRVSA